MTNGVKRSLECLAASKNEAVVDTLLAAIDNAAEPIRTEALKTLLDRKCKPGKRGIIARWDAFDEVQREILSQHSSRLTQELQGIIAAGDEALLPAAIETTIGTRDYDLFEPLIDAVEAGGGEEVGEALLRLTDCLYEELSHPRDYRQRRDPKQVRNYVMAALEASVTRYNEHGRAEPLEALLSLAARDNATIRSALQTGRGELAKAFLGILSNSQRQGAIRLALGVLDDQHPPLELIRAIARRADDPFLTSLFDRVSRDESQALAASLAKINDFSWVAENQLATRLKRWSESQQQSAVRVIMLSGMDADAKLAAMVCLLQHGQPAARVAAMTSIADFPGSSVNELVLAMIDDPDPAVQAAALVQLRPRKIPGAIAILIKRLECEHSEVSDAARGCLQEFTFSRFLAAFDSMAPDIRRSMGALVRKVDPGAVPMLLAELRGPTRANKLRAIEIAPLLGSDKNLQAALIAILEDSDHLVRAAAATQLAKYPGDASINALRRRLTDESPTVQEAVETSLEILGGSLVIDEKSTIQWADLLEAGMRSKQ